MGVPTGKLVHARYRHGTGCRNDCSKTPANLCRSGRRTGLLGHLIAVFLLISTGAAKAEVGLRIATLHTGLKRQGPGLLLRDILRGDDKQVLMVRDMVVAVGPDVILLTRFDYDLGLVAIRAFSDLLADAGLRYPYIFSEQPNSGVSTGHDLNGDGWLGGAADAQGYGDFNGHGGMAVLSRYPIDVANVKNLSHKLWEGGMFNGHRLSSVGHWDVPVLLPHWNEPLHLLAYHAGTPAFDGRSGRNSRRNAAENRVWLKYLDGAFGGSVPASRFIILGDSNLDPNDGEGQRDVMRTLLSDARIQDPQPISRGAVGASKLQAGPNISHSGDPALDTADFRDQGGPGNLRVDYVLPSVDLRVLDTGVFWPAADEPQAKILNGRQPETSWHGLVWVDIAH